METKDFLQTPFVDSERLKNIRLALTKAYSENERVAIEKSAQEAQRYVDEGGDVDYGLDDALECYNGTDPEKLADQYILRLLLDRHCDDDYDKDYIRTGWKKELDTNYQRFLEYKEKHPDTVLLFRDGDEAYCAYEQDADVLNKVCDCPLLNWNGVKAAGFPKNALDINLPRLVRAGHRVGIFDQTEPRKPVSRKRITETVRRKEPVQLELFTF